MTQVQGLASLPVYDHSQPSTACACALVDLVEAVTHVAGSKAELQAQLTTQLAKDNPTDGIEASHLPPPPIDWSHVTGLLPVIGQCVRLFKEQFVSLEESVAKVSQSRNFEISKPPCLRYLFQVVQTQTMIAYCRILPTLDHHV